MALSKTSKIAVAAVVILVMIVIIVMILAVIKPKSPTTQIQPPRANAPPTPTRNAPPTPTRNAPPTPTRNAPPPPPPPPPPAPPSKWIKVKNRNAGESSTDWSFRIYNAITGGASAGEDPNSGGIQNNISGCGMGNLSSLTEKTAKCFCDNPCYWYYGQYNKKAEMNNAAMCGCNPTNAINF